MRVEADLGADRMNAKIRNAQLMKVPYMLVVGDQEMADSTVALRKRDGSRSNGLSFADFQALVKEDRKPRVDVVRKYVRRFRQILDAPEGAMLYSATR